MSTFDAITDKYWVGNKPAHLRYGQWLMNLIWSEDPELYRKLRDTGVDCFYDDRKINDVLEFCRKESHEDQGSEPQYRCTDY